MQSEKLLTMLAGTNELLRMTKQSTKTTEAELGLYGRFSYCNFAGVYFFIQVQIIQSGQKTHRFFSPTFQEEAQFFGYESRVWHNLWDKKVRLKNII